MSVETSEMTRPYSSFQIDNTSLFALPHDHSNFQKRWNNTGILLKTKDRCGKPGREAGMSMKTKEISAQRGNVTETKGGYS
jgi:hypothetical protein